MTRIECSSGQREEDLFSPEKEKLRYPYIAVMGPPGVGKSSLVKIFKDDPNFYALEELVDLNPYVGDSYQDSDGKTPDGRAAFRSQVRFRELKICQRSQTRIFYQKGIVMQDTPSLEDEMYELAAYEEGRMSEADHQKYLNHSPELEEILPIPDLLIWLKVSLGVLNTRIFKRGRDWEEAFTPFFRKRMIELCQKAAEEYEGHVLVLDTDKLDYAHTKKGITQAVKEIKTKIVEIWGDGQGTGIDGTRIILPTSLIEEVENWKK